MGKMIVNGKWVNVSRPDSVKTQPAAPAGSTPTDTEILNWLAEQCFLPDDRPNTGVYAVMSEQYAPLGAFTGDNERDHATFRIGVIKAMME